MRVVIMDGELDQVAALQRTLAAHDLAWTVHVPGEDPAAFDAIARRPPDALVYSLPLPTAQAELLARLREAFPEAIRILLLGAEEDSVALCLRERAHRILRKPMDPDALIDGVESVYLLREYLASPELTRYIAGVEVIPAPPQMYLELLQVLWDLETPIERVAAVLSKDPGVIAQVLRLCNSAYFNLGREVSDIRTAVTRVGLQAIRQMVLAGEVFGRASALSPEERVEYQSRALRISRLAGRLLPGPSQDMASTAGMLAEVGLLLPAPDDGSAFDHTTAGAYLLGLWGLPQPVVDAVAFHRHPQRRAGTGFWLTGAVHVAAALINGDAPDTDYLRRVGVLDRLPQWKALAEQDADLSIET